MCRLSWNLGASTCWNPQGLSRPVMGLLYLIPKIVLHCVCVCNIFKKLGIPGKIYYFLIDYKKCSLLWTLAFVCITSVYTILSITFCLRIRIWTSAISVLLNTEVTTSQRLSIIDPHYALSYITTLFDTQAPSCLGIHVPSSGTFSCPRELLESRNVYVVCHILWMLVACVSETVYIFGFRWNYFY
jgi:hypothetical protein